MTHEDNTGSQLMTQPPAISTPAVSTPAPTATKKESMGNLWKSSGKEAIETVGNTETVTGTHRQIIDAGLLGICITFLIAMLTMQSTAIDVNLNNAVTTFGIAVPLIGWGYLQAAVKTKPGHGEVLLKAILVGSAVAEGVGELAAVIGVFFIFRHFSSTASAVFIWSAIFAIGIVPVLSFIGLFIYAVMNRKELVAKQQAKSAAQAAAPATTQVVMTPANSNP